MTLSSGSGGCGRADRRADLPQDRSGKGFGVRWLGLLALVPLSQFWTSAPAAAGQEVVAPRITAADAGDLPAGWTAARTGKGEGSVWEVVADRRAPGGTGLALAQTATSPGALFSLCVAEAVGPHRDVEVGVALKAAGGEIDQGGASSGAPRTPTTTTSPG
jgi:hypothetical protein